MSPKKNPTQPDPKILGLLHGSGRRKKSGHLLAVGRAELLNWNSGSQIRRLPDLRSFWFQIHRLHSLAPKLSCSQIDLFLSLIPRSISSWNPNLSFYQKFKVYSRFMTEEAFLEFVRLWILGTLHLVFVGQVDNPTYEAMSSSSMQCAENCGDSRKWWGSSLQKPWTWITNSRKSTSSMKSCIHFEFNVA